MIAGNTYCKKNEITVKKMVELECVYKTKHSPSERLVFYVFINKTVANILAFKILHLLTFMHKCAHTCACVYLCLCTC